MFQEMNCSNPEKTLFQLNKFKITFLNILHNQAFLDEAVTNKTKRLYKIHQLFSLYFCYFRRPKFIFSTKAKQNGKNTAQTITQLTEKRMI